MKFDFKINYLNLGLAILSGLLLSFSFPPFHTGFLSFFSLVPLLVLFDRLEKNINIIKYSYLSFLIFHCITIYWIGGWEEKTDIFMILGSIGLIVLNPIFYLIPVSLYIYIKKNFSRNMGLFALPFLWVSIEYFRSIEDTQFPWLTLGNALSYNLSIIQIVNVTGVWGLSVLIIFINILLYLCFYNFKNKEYRFGLNKISIAVIVLLFLFIYGKVLINEGFYNGQEIKVGLVQPNLDPWDKWNTTSLNDLIRQYIALSDSCIQNGAELLIWPETALPVYFLSGRYDEELSQVYNFVNQNKIHLLTGLPLLEVYRERNKAPSDAKLSFDSSFSYTSYNGSVLFEPNKPVEQKYGKMKLVPFSERTPYLEYVPFLERLINWSVGLGSWNIGKNKTVFNYVLNDVDTVRFSGLICYESVFPGFNSDFVRNGANFITILTNDSWFGKASGPVQHKQFAVFRAIENKRWVIRATNGGISCFIDPQGRIIVDTKMYKKTFLVSSIFLENDLTLYTRYKDIICYFSLAVTGLITIITIIKKRTGKNKK